MEKEKTFIIATGKSSKEKYWKKEEISWDSLVKKLSQTKRTNETEEDYKNMAKVDRDRIKDVGGFVAGELKGNRRLKTDILNRSLLTLDIDYYSDDIDKLLSSLDYAYCLYSTHSHRADNQRYRLIIPTDRDMKTDEYQAISRMVASKINIEIFDKTTHDPERLMYWPSTPIDGEYIFKCSSKDVEFLKANDILNEYTFGWQDVNSWPKSSREIKHIQKELKKQEDPLTKKGIIGAFCRTYSITEAIAEFISDIYIPGTDNTRYTYAEGSTTGGVVIYDDKFSYSHHGTDPASNICCNAFDLIRIHKFGELDEEAKEGTPANRLPSFTKMSEFSASNEKVKIQIGSEKMLAAQEDFDVVEEEIEGDEDVWLTKLDVKNNGEYACTRKNIRLIMQNNPLIKDKIYYDIFEGTPKIKSPLPWHKKDDFIEGTQWGDWDDSYLKEFLENYYNISVTENKYNDATNMIFDDSSVHPVREYLKNLEWDGEYRLESIFIDYLGAEDTEYNRMVAKKILVAAVKRVFEPGCKYEELPILFSTTQGLGKSTLIEKLGGRWYSDSLRLDDIKKDIKRATEQTEGSWLLELPDLKAIYSKDADLIKGFLSGKEDKFRKAYDRRVSKIARQFIIIGTTNNQEFLSDRTGNRRYLPVTTDVNKPTKDIFTISEYDIGQIWSEAYKYYKEGYHIYLNKEEKELAAKVQEMHTFTSEEEEEFMKYINRPILKLKGMADWYSLSVSDRVNYLYPPEEFAEDTKPKKIEGTEERTKICIAAIYDEFISPRYKLKPINLTRDVELDIKNMLIKAGWVKYTKGDRGKLKFGIYGKKTAYVKK